MKFISHSFFFFLNSYVTQPLQAMVKLREIPVWLARMSFFVMMLAMCFVRKKQMSSLSDRGHMEIAPVLRFNSRGSPE